MTQTVLPQLQKVIEDLEAQETALAAQLTEVKAKREAIRAVLPMFGESTEPIPQTTQKAKSPAATAKRKTAKSPAATAKRKTARKSASMTKAKASKTSKPATKSTRKPKATSRKKDGRAATWQKYTLPGVGERPISEAVQVILATKPEEDFKIADVMSGLFKENMPKVQYLKARNRISNILSGGVRDGIWHKGARGAYRLTAAS